MRDCQTNLHAAWAPVPANGPLNVQLAEALRSQIVAGELVAGQPLAPSRVLAESLGVSRWVVTQAYEQLQAEGYVTGRVGSGTHVSERAITAASPTKSGAARAAADRAGRASRSPDECVGTHDLRPVAPDLSSFPRPAWRAAINWVLQTVSVHDLGYPVPQGDEAFRSVMSDYLRRTRGVQSDPFDVQVTSGTRSAIALICQVLRSRGVTRLAIENPGWPWIREVARLNELDVVGIPVDDRGARIDELVGLDVGAFFVSPTHQFPMGVPLHPSRRRQLLAWAAENDRLIIEDDFDAEFRYDRQPVGALAALARSRVVYLGSCSKSLSPSLRLGWVVVPSDLQRDFDLARSKTGSLVPTLDQLTFARLVSTGNYDRHIRRMRKIYLSRRASMLGALNKRMPGVIAPSIAAGLHLVWWLPDGADELAFADRCASNGLSVVTMADCRLDVGRPGLVLGYGNVVERKAAAAVAALGRAYRMQGA
jgi:GntR family transcriptional regulator/MocR family aminotransferase